VAARRRGASAGALRSGVHFLRGERRDAARDPDGAAAAFRTGFDRGGDDYRARMALGSLLSSRGKTKDAIAEFTAAERVFPGFPDPHFSAELELARLHEAAGATEKAMAARLRWLAWNAGDYPVRAKVAEWLDGQGRHAESVVLWEEANEVDPFRRHLHVAWGLALRALGRHAEALREFRVGRAIALALDGDVAQGGAEEMTREELIELAGVTPEEWDRLSLEERQRRIEEGLKQLAADGAPRKSAAEKRFHAEEPLLHGYEALTELDLGHPDAARAAVERALALDPECAPALEAKARLP